MNAFLGTKGMLMKRKHHLVSTGIILSLLGSNIIIGSQYVKDSNEKQKEINIQYKIIEQNKKKQTLLEEKSVKNTEKIDDLSIKNSLLTDELNKVKLENNQLKTENESLKKQLIEKKEANKKRQLNMELTYYVADCRGCSGITKTGIDVSNTIYYKGMRVIATDPRVIKLHSIVRIQTKTESYIAYAADTGGAIKNNLVDVLVSSRSEALRLGRQNAVVTILSEGSDI
ncbi:3D domain-containing protein [Neobacillus vireti]|uniref:3D domain-containing protein n=1 Tax=Neobacillus vireti TaxID=220686 RepID=UPI002FFEDF05